jgi:hypothetical protein
MGDGQFGNCKYRRKGIARTKAASEDGIAKEFSSR